MNLVPEQLLAEVEDIIRTMPSRETIHHHDENFAWLGRASALIEAWQFPKTILMNFSDYGTVQSCDLVMDKVTGESKGFAFVEMP